MVSDAFIVHTLIRSATYTMLLLLLSFISNGQRRDETSEKVLEHQLGWRQPRQKEPTRR
jgi:hypothetical protein